MDKNEEFETKLSILLKNTTNIFDKKVYKELVEIITNNEYKKKDLEDLLRVSYMNYYNKEKTEAKSKIKSKSIDTDDELDANDGNMNSIVGQKDKIIIGLKKKIDELTNKNKILEDTNQDIKTLRKQLDEQDKEIKGIKEKDQKKIADRINFYEYLIGISNKIFEIINLEPRVPLLENISDLDSRYLLILEYYILKSYTKLNEMAKSKD